MAKSEAHVSHDVVQVDHQTLAQEILDVVDSRVALFIWGPPGVGKSYSAADAAAMTAHKVGRLVVDWNRSSRALRHALAEGAVPRALAEAELSRNGNASILAKMPEPTLGLSRFYVFGDHRLAQRDASDLTGLPSIDQPEFVEWRPQLMFLVLSKPEIAGMLLLDEIPQALPIVQNAAYQLIQDRCCGELAFSDQVTILAAGNRLTDGGSQFQIPPALANRFVHVELAVPPVEDVSGRPGWATWAMDHGVDGRIISFLRWRPNFLMDSMDEVRKNRAMAWASPRSWTKASAMIANLAGGTDAALNRLYTKVAMAVGEARAIEFRAFVKSVRTLDLNDILEHPEQVEKLDLGLKWALISAMADHYSADKKRMNPILGVCEHLDADFAVSMLRMIRRVDKNGFVARLVKCENRKVALDFMKYFEDDQT